jgi:hypothetical protein
MLAAKLFINVPRPLELLFGALSAFSDAATRAKFRMVSGRGARSALLAAISPDQLPAAYGGFQQEDVEWKGVQQARRSRGGRFLEGAPPPPPPPPAEPTPAIGPR